MTLPAGVTDADVDDQLIERLIYFSGWKQRNVPHIELSKSSSLVWDAIDEIRRLRKMNAAALASRVVVPREPSDRMYEAVNANGFVGGPSSFQSDYAVMIAVVEGGA